jgi:glutamine cyclotransferase
MPREAKNVSMSLRRRSASGLACSVLALVCVVRASPAWPAPATAACGEPIPLRFEIERKIARSELGFTQGLIYRDGKLYESTGRIDGPTRINIITLNGQVTTLVDLGTRVFGEGLTILNDEIIQLTWQDHVVYAYDLAGRLKRRMHNAREGWGLTDDGRELLFSDGGDAIHFADPATFAVRKSVKLRTNRPDRILGLNELEFVGGRLYGNIFTTRLIVRIDPSTGCLDAVGDLGLLWQAMSPQERAHVDANPQYVLNGIAYDSASERFYLTGKRWQSIFVGRFLER